MNLKPNHSIIKKTKSLADSSKIWFVKVKLTEVLNKIQLDINIKYDPNTQSLNVEFPLGTIFGEGGCQAGRGPHLILVKTIERNKSRHKGTNSFGLSTKIARANHDKYFIGTLKNLPLTPIIHANINPEDAREFKANPELIFLGTLSPFKGSAYSSCKKWGDNPTISKPYDYTYFYHALYMNLMEVWVVNFQS